MSQVVDISIGVCAMLDWKQIDWLHSGRRLVEWTNKTNPSDSAMLIIRHSHRKVINDIDEMVSGGLTDLGKKTSREMGSRLPTDRPYSVYTSFVPRCFQTAEAICEGITDNDGEVIDIDPLPSLVGPQVVDREVWNNLHPNGENVTDFVNNWAKNMFGEKMEPFEEYIPRLLNDIFGRLKETAEPQIHLHITHDLAMMCLKRTIYEEPLEIGHREPYLGGLGIKRNNSDFVIFIGRNGEKLKFTFDRL